MLFPKWPLPAVVPTADARRFEDLLRAITYPGLTFVVEPEPGRYFLRVSCDNGTCNDTGEPLAWKGRKWPLSVHMTDGEVVQTAFLALMTALEHEAREQFKFCGVPVMSPHYDIYKLVDMHRLGVAEKEREG